MRSHLLARRVVLAPALGLALVAAVAACSSSSTSSVSSPPSTHPPSSAPASPSATALIAANWQAFFNGKTSAAKKITLLQDGQTYAAVIQAQSGSALARSASATVTKVTVTSPTQAKVTYTILLGTTPALTNQSGVAVYQNGTWKVGDASFCGLLALENGGKAPPVCSSRTPD